MTTPIKSALYLLPVLGLLLSACDPANTDAAARQAGTVNIAASASVRVNGQPLARAATGQQAGKPLLDAACAGDDGLDASPNVRINGAPATVVKPGATSAECPADTRLDTATNVEVGN